jgi:hypothetical protein
MLFRETVAVYCENHTEHTNTLCGQNAELLIVIAGGECGNSFAKGSNYWELIALFLKIVSGIGQLILSNCRAVKYV